MPYTDTWPTLWGDNWGTFYAAPVPAYGSTHTYTAVLIGAPDVPLSVRGGRITLDSGSAPHVQGSLDIAWPDAATLTALDPRLNARVRVNADAVFPSFSQSRTFNLGLRSRPTRHRDAVVSLDLTSDEALLSDYRAKLDDRTPRTLETSLRSIVNYVLGKIGATLAVTPANDADMTAYWSLSNLAKDPRGTDIANFTSGGVTGSLSPITGLGPVEGITTAVRFTTSAASTGVVRLSHVVSASPGRMYTFSVRTRFGLDGSNPGSKFMRASVTWLDRDDNVLSEVQGPGANMDDPGGGTSVWERLSVTALAPPAATAARINARLSGGLPLGGVIDATGWLAVEGAELVTYFDGASTVTGYVCTWDDGIGPSVSTRTPLSPIDARDPDSLVWRAGDSAMDFLHPLVQAAGYRLVCDEARVWTLRSSSYVAAGNMTFAAGVNLTDATDTLSRDSDDWFDAQVTRYVWEDANGIARTKVDYWGLTSSPTKVRLVEVNAPYPGTGRSQYAVKRAQGRGRVVQAAKVSDWTARAEQAVTVLLDGAPTQTGLTESVTFDLDLDEVSIATRTTDTLPGSIDLLPGTIDALTGVINDL
jgi:hypothetical protein